MKLRSVLLAATVLALPAVASAQPIEGLYVGAGAGYNYLQDLDVTGAVGAVGSRVGTGSGHLSGEGGFVGSASLGYGLGNGLRLEIQGDYRQDHQRLKDTPFGVQGGTADTQSYGGYLNALYDFDIGMPFIYPYVGVGAGYRWLELHGATAYIPGVDGSFVGRDNSKGAFSAQAMLGAAFPFPGMPGLSITAEYRFTGAFEKTTFGGSVDSQTVPASYAPIPSTVRVGNQYNHSFLVGLRYAFNVAPPPPPPAPAPAPAPVAAPTRTYLVFFDWDRADLTARARQIIGEAAENSKKVQVTRIEVNGYTDLSGTAAYNQKLSVRRAEAVAAELVRDGVPRGEIVARGFGESNPLVPTAQGVREPQNRRVEIILK
jgi:outer membrane protein OmpA-like peptidoglycan-associated protein